MNKVIFFTELSKLPDALSFFDIQGFKQKKIPLKLHMGEPKNKYFPRPHEVKYAIDALKKHQITPFLFDTTVAYSGDRHTTRGYENVARLHGFSPEKMGCPTIIDDSGEDVEVENRHYTVAQHIYQATHIFAWSHVKGHVATGLGGAIKNFGMGGVTKETKLWMHQSSRPKYHPDACTHCGVCAEVCPFDALSVSEHQWNRKKQACFGCGVCVEACPQDALSYVDADLQYLLSCAAYACVKDKNVLYLNDVNRIAQSCDCDPLAEDIIAPDIGYLLANDPVAIDAASLHLIHNMKPNIFKEIHHVDPFKQIRYGEKIGLGDAHYQQIDL